MKYRDGGWLLRDGFEVDYAAHIYTYGIYGNSLSLYAPFRLTTHKGMSLDGGMLTIVLDAPRKDMISVDVVHHKGIMKKGPEFDLNLEKTDVNIVVTDDLITYTNGDMRAEILLGDDINISYFYKDRFLSASGNRSKAYIKDDKGIHHISDQLNIGVRENIYGLGERFTPFIKNGQSVELWNEDGGTGTEQAYKNIPFFVSNNNYGVFVNQPEKVSIEVGSDQVSKVQFSVPGESLSYIVMAADSIKDVLGLYTDLTGKPGLPPAWSFGLWLSTSFLTDYDEDTVNHFVDGMIERDIPLEVFHFDCLWMKEFEWCNFLWDERMFPDPKGMIQRLKDKGLKISLWINPYIGQKSPLFDIAMEKGYFLKRANGDVWQWDKWQAGLAVIDFTNPEAVAWYEGHLQDLVDIGVDSFKTDFGERIPTDVVYFDGSDPYKMHNYYSYQYNEIVFNLLEKNKGKDEAVLFARSASVGSQKFPVHWGGDNTADYPSMAESLRAGLSFGMSGFGFWSHDIGGFESGCTPDLYKRWTQFGLLSSHSRYHGSWEYKVPWLFGDEAVEITKQFTNLKLKLMPYIYTEAIKTTQSGVPMMRSMILDHQEDLTTHALDLQYKFGPDLLVAPIFNESGEVSTYLPHGTWTHLLDNRRVKGNQWVNETYDYTSLPLFVAENTLLPMGTVDNVTVYDYINNLEIHVFEVDTQSVDIYDAEGNKATVSVRKENDSYVVESNNIKQFNLVLRNTEHTRIEDGVEHEFGTLVTIENSIQTIKLV